MKMWFSFEVSLLFTISSIIIKIILMIIQIEHILVGCSSIMPFITLWYTVIVIILYSSKYSDCFYLLRWLHEDLLFVKPLSSTSLFSFTFLPLVAGPLKFYIQIPWWHLLLSHLDWRWMKAIPDFSKMSLLLLIDTFLIDLAKTESSGPIEKTARFFDIRPYVINGFIYFIL